MKMIFILISSILLALPVAIRAQKPDPKREPSSTPSSIANFQLRSKLIKQVTSNYKIYFFGKTSHTFSVDKRKKVTITRRCGDKLETSTCMAAVKLKEVNLNDLTKEDLEGGKNPGPVLCQKTLNADVVVGKDRNGNISNFCAFKDGTMVSADTLAIWAKINSKKKN